ncbi:hypothetical protein C8F04DRAFT_1091632 [Mycena alexandri]|uniref:BTB domain-containing protein n=1 Tax=Mycena alexandri TaxID=1745969 RepID=A0AAD6T266_9AGAR|nr:hypothetical protein C8F04DRAFT_1091632 [Mycena alexandri]
MPYGDIIIQAESTQFRVNRDILARHSSVFQDMFLLPQPPNEETVDGCHIVHLSDSATDVHLLLAAFYDPYHHKVKRPVKLIACMLRLGNKYEVACFKEDAVSRIHHDLPTRLVNWDRRCATGHLDKIEPTGGVLVDLLNLAYETGIYTSIPALAFRCLHVYSLERLFDGIERADGSRATIPDSTKVVLALALERIQLFQRTNFAWLKEDDIIPCSSCKSRTKCAKEQALMVRIECLDRKVDLSYTLDTWSKAGQGKLVNHLCCACEEEEAKGMYDAERKKAWNLLPTFFGLPAWAELKDAD